MDMKKLRESRGRVAVVVRQRLLTLGELGYLVATDGLVYDGSKWKVGPTGHKGLSKVVNILNGEN